MDNPINQEMQSLCDDEDFKDDQALHELQHLCSAALMQLRLKFEVLDSEFHLQHSTNPIHHIESMLKSPKSMAAKLRKNGYAVTIESAK